MKSPVRTLLVGGLLAGALGGCAPAVHPVNQATIAIHYSHFAPTRIEVPAGVPITFTIVNDDPIDHEWLIGDSAFHERHRTGTEPVHGDRPDEVSTPPMSVRTTTLTFAPGTYTFICHFPGHEAYGMIGVLVAK